MNLEKPICIIPARGGSKRIKNKNIIIFFGKPIIAYSIVLALKSKLFSNVIVSTDSAKIKRIAEKYLSPVIASLKELVEVNVPAINTELDANQAPWTPGRIIEMKN